MSEKLKHHEVYRAATEIVRKAAIDENFPFAPAVLDTLLILFDEIDKSYPS